MLRAQIIWYNGTFKSKKAAHRADNVITEFVAQPLNEAVERHEAVDHHAARRILEDAIRSPILGEQPDDVLIHAHILPRGVHSCKTEGTEEQGQSKGSDQSIVLMLPDKVLLHVHIFPRQA